MSLFDATFGQESHDRRPPEIDDVYWVPFRVPWIPGGCELSVQNGEGEELPQWLNIADIEPILKRMEKAKMEDLNRRSILLLWACCFCGIPLCFLAGLERRHQQEMRELFDNLKGVMRPSGGEVRFVSVVRRYQGTSDEEVFRYEDKWLGFAKDAEAAEKLNDIPNNWLPYQKSHLFFSFNSLSRGDRAY